MIDGSETRNWPLLIFRVRMFVKSAVNLCVICFLVKCVDRFREKYCSRFWTCLRTGYELEKFAFLKSADWISTSSQSPSPCLLIKISWISQNVRNSLFYSDFYCNNLTKSRRPQAANATLLVNLLCNTYISFELQVRKDWKAVIQVETEDLNQMPIVDFAPGEFLTSNEFGFEVGPICFS